MTSRHAAIWIDHHEARVFHVGEKTFDETTLHAPTHHVHRHPNRGTAEHNHPDDQLHFFAAVIKALDGVEEILIVGPSTAKLQLITYAHKHAPALAAHIVGVETVDHPTDGQIAAYARKYFLKVDGPHAIP
jgi:stalled ribosome rescue protein Dom34